MTSVNKADAQEPQEVLIAVMGCTGVGKSTFINLASGSHLAVGNSLDSCTASVLYSNSFEFQGRCVRFIDTPGFDDAVMSDFDVLKMVAHELQTLYENGRKLTGILYLHRITDVRVGGTARKNLTAFGKLCGDNALRIAVVVTTMWDGRDVGELETREHQLRTSPQLFEPFLAKGAKLLRHDNTTDAVHRILKEVISMKPLPLKIQEELVVEKRRLIDTDAAVYLEGELRVKAEEYKREIEELREEMREALSNMDLELEKELQRNKADLEDRLKKAKQEHESLSSQYAAERRRLEIMNKKQDITILQDSDIQRRPNVRGRETDVSSHEDHPIVFIGSYDQNFPDGQSGTEGGLISRMSRTERGWEAAGFGHYSLPDEQNQQEQMRILEEEHGGLCTALLGICLSLLHLLWEMLLHGIRSLRTMD